MHQHCPQREQQKETADRSYLKPDNHMVMQTLCLKFQIEYNFHRFEHR
jgi:hypothetical protein